MKLKDVRIQEIKLKKGIFEINKMIEFACDKGEFKIRTLICHDWGSPSDLVRHYIADGYAAYSWSEQTSPNDSDDFIHVSWDE